VRESRLVLLTFLVDWSLLLMDSRTVRGVVARTFFFHGAGCAAPLSFASYMLCQMAALVLLERF